MIALGCLRKRMGGRRQNEVCLGSVPSLAAELGVHPYLTGSEGT
jgi:hypothetical protein